MGHFAEVGGDAIAARHGRRGAFDGLDPRVRILGAAVFSVVVVAQSSLVALVLALGIAVLFMALSGLPAKRTLKRMAAMDSFILFMLATLPFTVPGEPVVHVFGLAASREGFVMAIEIALTANAVVLTLLSLVGGMEPTRFGHALHALKMPEKLVHLLLFTVRYVGVLEDEYRRLRTAMKARGFRPGNNRHTYKTFGYLVGMMLIRSVERSERILQAMKCRGFDGMIPVIAVFGLGRRDAAFAGALGLAVLALVVIEVAAWSR